MTRNPALDGVRGIAILAVFIYHVTVNWGDPTIAALGSWGWMGVDLFFVLSGYLITGILIDTRGSTDYYRSFYVKRALRILPAFVVFMLVLAFLAPMQAGERRLFFHGQAWYWGYAANILLAQHGWSSLPYETGHLWSLAVEEQFYFLWPFVIACCKRTRTVSRVAIATIIAVAILRVWAVEARVDPLAIYVLPLFRADALAWGALIAASERQAERRAKTSVLGLTSFMLGTLLLAAVVLRLHNANNPSPSMQLLGFPALGAMAAGLVGLRPVWLGCPPLCAMGRYSYAFYLWHAPILLCLKRSVPWIAWPWFVVVGFLLSLTAALLSAIVIERPALALRNELLIVTSARPTLIPSDGS